MKVTNWCKSLRVALLAGGVWLPGAVYAQNIPLGDPSFEDYVVPANPGYAYAAPPFGSYRPTSAWVDDLDGPGGLGQDNNDSNWLYDANYAQTGSAARRRPTPRTGNQAMHGLLNYNAQETTAVFEANKSYVLSAWSQGDDDATATSSRVFLYIFDGTIPFSEDNSLVFRRYAPDTGDFVNRVREWTAEQSKSNWTEISLVHAVPSGAPEIGHPIGVGFWGADDAALDDISLRAVPIESTLMFLEVNTTTGQVTLKNQIGQPINIDYYEVTSASGSLNATAWNSLQEQNRAGFPAGNGSGNGWEQFGAAGSRVIGESYLRGNSAVTNNASVGLGQAFNVGGAQDLVFQYSEVDDAGSVLLGDYNNNGTVDAADYVIWRKTDTSQQGYTDWRTNFGATGGPSGPGTLMQGFVRYVTAGVGSGAAAPEPAGVLLVGMGLASLAVATWRRTPEN
ncbi:MAG TPA: hypothetical protein VJ828_16785 [Lacipirellulaceae bacterium]|nr:hypothetical protein [Lacipirellulaceae bacterium]